MMAVSRRWTNLATAAGAVTSVLFAGFDLLQWTLAYLSDRFHNDFTFYYAAARIGSRHGWSSIYDLALLQQELDAMDSRIKIAALARYLSPPPVAWSALPLTTLPFPTAYLIWSALLLSALALTWWLGAPGRGPVRLVHLAAALGWLPVIYCLQLGQPGLVVALGVAASFILLNKGHSAWAGVALGALVFKPQLAFLVPPALFIAGRYRTAIFCGITVGLLALASAAALGPDGISTYAARLSTATTFPVNRELTLDALIGNQVATRAVQILIAAWACFLAFRMRHRAPHWIYATAILGGMLASPYLHLDDLLMLGLAAWLVLRVEMKPSTVAYLVVATFAVEGVPIWGSLPLIAAELVGLTLISAVALKPGSGVPAPHAAPNPQRTAEPPRATRPTP
jgi:Glycosyltransferase family 87